MHTPDIGSHGTLTYGYDVFPKIRLTALRTAISVSMKDKDKKKYNRLVWIQSLCYIDKICRFQHKNSEMGQSKMNRWISHHTGLGDSKRPTMWTTIPDKTLTISDHKKGIIQKQRIQSVAYSES